MYAIGIYLVKTGLILTHPNHIIDSYLAFITSQFLNRFDHWVTYWTIGGKDFYLSFHHIGIRNNQFINVSINNTSKVV